MKHSLPRSALSGCGVIAAAFFLVGSALEIHPRPTASTPCLIIIEPEQNTTFAPRTHALQAADASQGGFVSIQGWNVDDPLYGRSVAGETPYPIQISESGTYYIWLRTRWNGTCANSVTFYAKRADAVTTPDESLAGHRSLVGNDMIHNVWHWIRGPVLGFNAGDYELLIGTRETGAEIDCVLLTTDPEHVPLGVPSAEETATLVPGQKKVASAFEFTENFTSGRDQTSFVSLDWLVDDSEWQQRRRPGRSAVGPCLSQISLAQARTPLFAHGHIQCALDPFVRAGVGLFFGRQSSEDYFIARIARNTSSKLYAGKVQVCHQREESLVVLAEADIDIRQSGWELFEARMSGDFCQVHVGGRRALEMKLPRSCEGHVGLYVDGRDQMLHPDESIPSLLRVQGELIKVERFPPRFQGKDCWPGVVAGYTSEAFHLARWSNLSSDGSYAKRLELIRVNRPGDIEPLAASWGVFKREDCPRLMVRRYDGVLSALLGEKTLCSARAALKSDLAGCLVKHQPRAIFGDFVIRSFRIQSGAGMALETNARAEEPRDFDVAGAGGFAKEDWTSSILGAWDRPFAVVTVMVPRTELPCGVPLSLRRDGNDILWLVEDPLKAPRGIFQTDETEFREFRPKAVSEDAGGELALQLVFDSGEFGAFLDGQLVLLAKRTSEEVGGIAFVSHHRDGPSARVTVAPRPRESLWFALGYGWPAEQVAGRVLHGDAAITVEGKLGSICRYGLLQLHASRPNGRSGYEVEFKETPSPRWRFLRNGTMVASGALRGTPDDYSHVRLAQRGHIVLLQQDNTIIGMTWDSTPIREGFIRATRDYSSTKISGLGADLRQCWDILSVFHQDSGAALAVASWKTLAGQWVLTESASGLSGFLMGLVDHSEQAVIEYRGDLSEQDVLAELRLGVRSITPGTSLAFVFEVDNAEGSVEVAGFSCTSLGNLKCRLRRNNRIAEGEVSIDPSHPAPVMTVLRTESRLAIEWDHVPVAELREPTAHRVCRVRIRLVGQPGQSIAIRSIALQKGGLSPEHTPQHLRRYLQFLRGATAADE